MAGGHRKGAVAQRFGNRVRGCASLQRQRRVQSAQTVGTDYGYVCQSTESPHVGPIVAATAFPVRRRKPSQLLRSTPDGVFLDATSLLKVHRDFDLGFVSGLVRTRRQNRRSVVLCKLLIVSLHRRIVPARGRHRALEIVGNPQPRHASELLDRAHVTAQKVLAPLRRAGVRKRQIRRAEHRDK